MKIELILFFVVACMAEDYYYENLDDYPLFQDYFGDLATLRHLGGYLVSDKNGLVDCYLIAKKELKEIAQNFKIKLTEAKSITSSVAGSYQNVAYFLIKTLEEISVKIIWCQEEIWKQIDKRQTLIAIDVIAECGKKFSNLFGCYESQLKIIKDENSKVLFEKKMEEIIAEVKKELKRVNDSFEKCVKDRSSVP